MRYEVVNLNTRAELLVKIEAFLSSNGWSVSKKNNDLLYATDSFGESLAFEFSAATNNKGSSKIWLCDDIDSSLNPYEQTNALSAAEFDFQKDINAELSKVYLIGDNKSFMLYINSENSPSPYNFMFIASYVNKSHEFNGGRVCFSTKTIYNQYRDFIHNQIPFSNQTYGGCFFKIGGEWINIATKESNNTTILNNLCKTDKNPLSALSALSLLEISKSSLSGLYVLITPNFFYKNNEEIFVHAGEFDFVRVIKDHKEPDKRLINGQILNIADEKFMHLRPSLNPVNDNIVYTLAVKIE